MNLELNGEVIADEQFFAYLRGQCTQGSPLTPTGEQQLAKAQAEIAELRRQGEQRVKDYADTLNVQANRIALLEKERRDFIADALQEAAPNVPFYLQTLPAVLAGLKDLKAAYNKQRDRVAELEGAAGLKAQVQAFLKALRDTTGTYWLSDLDRAKARFIEINEQNNRNCTKVRDLIGRNDAQAATLSNIAAALGCSNTDSHSIGLHIDKLKSLARPQTHEGSQIESARKKVGAMVGEHLNHAIDRLSANFKSEIACKQDEIERLRGRVMKLEAGDYRSSNKERELYQRFVDVFRGTTNGAYKNKIDWDELLCEFAKMRADRELFARRIASTSDVFDRR